MRNKFNNRFDDRFNQLGDYAGDQVGSNGQGVSTIYFLIKSYTYVFSYFNLMYTSMIPVYSKLVKI